MLAELSPCGRERFLLCLPHILQRPYGLTDYMVPVDHYFRVREAYFSGLFEVTVHVDHYILYVFSVLKRKEILDQVALFAVGKYVRYLPAFRVGQDSLVLFSARVALELIYGQYLRKLLAGVVHELEISQRSLSRDVVLAADLLCRTQVLEVADHLCGEAVRHSVEPGKKAVFLIEPLPAGTAGIPTLSQVQICMHSMHVQILDSLYTVVVDALCLALTAWADVLLPRQLYLYAAACFIFINIFYDNIFQSEQF